MQDEATRVCVASVIRLATEAAPRPEQRFCRLNRGHRGCHRDGDFAWAERLIDFDAYAEPQRHGQE